MLRFQAVRLASARSRLASPGTRIATVSSRTAAKAIVSPTAPRATGVTVSTTTATDTPMRTSSPFLAGSGFAARPATVRTGSCQIVWRGGPQKPKRRSAMVSTTTAMAKRTKGSPCRARTPVVPVSSSVAEASIPRARLKTSSVTCASTSASSVRPFRCASSCLCRHRKTVSDSTWSSFSIGAAPSVTT